MALRTAPATDTKLALLSDLPLFRDLRRREITDLGRHVELVELPAGAVLQQQGDVVGQWIAVVDGTVLRLRNGQPAALLPAGSTWGEPLLATSSRQPSPETLVTLEPTTAVIAGPRHWRSLVAMHPGLGSGWTVPCYDDMEDVLVALEWALVVPR